MAENCAHGPLDTWESERRELRAMNRTSRKDRSIVRLPRAIVVAALTVAWLGACDREGGLESGVYVLCSGDQASP